MVISNDIVKKVFLNLEGTNPNGKSLFVIQHQLNLELYEAEQVVKRLKELSLINTIGAVTKDHPYDEILLLSSKGRYYIKREVELDKIISREDIAKEGSLKLVIQELVRIGETEKALEHLNVSTEGTIKKQAISLSSSYYNLKRNRNSGTLKYEEETQELNRINIAILDIIDSYHE